MPTFHKIFELSFCISSVYDPSSMPPSDSLPWLCYHPCSGISATNTVLTTIRTVLLFSALQVFDNLLRFTGWYPFPTFIWMCCWGQHIWLCTSKSRNWKKKNFLAISSLMRQSILPPQSTYSKLNARSLPLRPGLEIAFWELINYSVCLGN